jgi:hypothetical protein
MDKKLIIELAATELAEEIGLINMTRKELCDKVGIPDGAFMAIMDESFTDFISRLDLPTGDILGRKRVNPKLRRKHVLNAALELAKTKGYNVVTRGDIATCAGVSPGLISHYFKSIEALHVVILKTAIKQDIPEIIAQGLTNRDPIAIQAPKELKNKAIAYLAEL